MYASSSFQCSPGGHNGVVRFRSHPGSTIFRMRTENTKHIKFGGSDGRNPIFHYRYGTGSPNYGRPEIVHRFRYREPSDGDDWTKYRDTLPKYGSQRSYYNNGKTIHYY